MNAAHAFMFIVAHKGMVNLATLGDIFKSVIVHFIDAGSAALPDLVKKAIAKAGYTAL